MKKSVAIILLCFCINSAFAQSTVVVIAKDKAENSPLSAATISLGITISITDANGVATFSNIPSGKQVLICSFSGYASIKKNYTFPLVNTDTIFIFLEKEEAEEEMEEVIIQSTRSSRTIANTATRVEVIDGEELDEKNNMRPANVSMLLHESTGLQVQQTSATSGNAAIRVQGLDGRYTQLLKDGFPNFGNFASGLSILEIPPLDLKQIEIIKGPASTLYGGGAIAGVINFVSKTPGDELEANFMLNQSNIGQRNIGAFFSQKKGKIGFSFLGLVNRQKSYDVDNDDFSELPESNNFTINPNLYFYPNASTEIRIGHSFTKGTNLGGDMQVIDGKPDANHTYFEENKTNRNTSSLEFQKKFSETKKLKFKTSLTTFQRRIALPSYIFNGLSRNNFNELSLAIDKKKHTIITGTNVVYDAFTPKQTTNLYSRSFTAGVYIQDTWDISENIILESGLRVDHLNYKNGPTSSAVKNNQTFVLPRISALFKIDSKWSSRVSGGLGYKAPTLFNEQTESIQYQRLQNLGNVVSEQSIGTTADINYKTKIAGDLQFSINQLFFLTSISKPLVLTSDINSNLFFTNASKPVVSRGFETNLKFIYKNDLKLFVGYTFTDVNATYLPNNSFLPLVPKSKLNITMMYEKEDNFKIGLEGYHTGTQFLSNRTKTPAFWEFGFLAQKTFGKFSFFVNFENFTDQRQSNFKRVVNPPNTAPSFDEIWNHTEGFVWNGGMKISL